MGSALNRKRSSSRFGNAHVSRPSSIRTTEPNFDHGPKIGPFSKATVAAKRFAKVLQFATVGDIATAAGVSKETAKNWKLGKRMPSGEALLDLGTNLRIVNEYMHRRIDGLEDVEAQHAVAEFEALLASMPPHLRAAARAKLLSAPS